MHLVRNDFRNALALVAGLWMTIFLWTTSVSHCPLPEPQLPHGNALVLSGLSLPSLPRLFAGMAGDFPRDILRRELRAGRIGRDGGTLRCGPAVLVVPPDAVSAETVFLLEDISDHMPAVEFEQTATDLVLAPVLSLSYAGSPYDNSLYDASGLRIYRELAPGIFEPIPGHADLRARRVIGHIMANGRYVIG